MGVISRIFTPQKEERGFEDVLQSTLLGGGSSSSGVFVSEETALRNTVVYACVGLISSSLASVPLILYKKNGRERIRAVDHPLFSVLQTVGNREMSAFEVRETRLLHALLWGNSYAEIEYDENYNVVGLWPLAPNRVGVERNDKNELQYTYYSENGSWVFPSWKILHLRNKVVSGAVGLSPIATAMNALGLSKALEDFGSKYFKNGAKPSIILKHPGKLTPEAYKRLRASFSENWQGIENSHKIAILEEGLTPETLSIPPEEAQFLSTRKFQVAEIARLYQVPLHMLAELDRATFASVEQQGIDFKTFTVLPWAKRDEQVLMKDLLTEEERKDHYIEYLLDGLERADINTRTQSFSTMRQNGIITANEWRERENLNPVEGGDTLWIPLNMTEVGNEGQRSHEHGKMMEDRSLEAAAVNVPYKRALTQDEIERIGSKRQKIIRSTLPAFDDAAQRLVKREVADVKRAIKKYLPDDVAGFSKWLEGFYEDLQEFSSSVMKAPVKVLAFQIMEHVKQEVGEDTPEFKDVDTFIDGYLANFSRDYSNSSKAQIDDVVNKSSLDNENVADKVTERLDEWSETKADKTSNKEVFEAGNALVVASYTAAGVMYLRWYSRGDSCPFCKRMNGRVAGIQDYFVDNEEVEGNDETGSMKVFGKKRHGPLHSKCDCSVVAA